MQGQCLLVRDGNGATISVVRGGILLSVGALAEQLRSGLQNRVDGFQLPYVPPRTYLMVFHLMNKRMADSSIVELGDGLINGC